MAPGIVERRRDPFNVTRGKVARGAALHAVDPQNSTRICNPSAEGASRVDLGAIQARGAFAAGQTFYAQVLNVDLATGAAGLSNLVSFSIL
ncbi:MAG: hypothetical protein JNM84_10605 [Planctomycetes bacterium]|nr:hypothetical protein [Planctomycetota bacterium]